MLSDKFENYEIIFRVLLVDEETIVKRDMERPIGCRMGERSLILLKEFKGFNYEEKYILNTSDLTIENCIVKNKK